ncbi:MAG: hypothetical protein GW949_00295 [Spirochaetales bacterium]|nr:hypothetical protein [Spirochaetales bacterium]
MILVIGGANIDYHGRSSGAVHMYSSNPGIFTRSWGGVGRNIAENVALLGVAPSFIAAVGDDPETSLLFADLEKLGISTDFLIRVPGGRTSVYCEILDDQGDLVVAISDMDICLALTPHALEPHVDLIRSATIVVVDTNLSQETLEFLAGLADIRLFADPVSVSKAPRLLGILPKLYGCKPNRAEAEVLAGLEPSTGSSSSTPTIRDLALRLRDQGIQQVWVSDGPQGVYYAGSEGDAHYPAVGAGAPGPGGADQQQSPPTLPRGTAPLHLPPATQQQGPAPPAVGNTTGAGDSYTAALVWALDRGLSARRATEIGGKVAALTCQVETTTNPLLKTLRNQL